MQIVSANGLHHVCVLSMVMNLTLSYIRTILYLAGIQSKGPLGDTQKPESFLSGNFAFKGCSFDQVPDTI
jgi:hypothetical protein